MFTKEIDSRIKLILVVMILLFILIIGRVVYIQMIDYEKLTELSDDLWSRELPLEPDRGLILDRNGIVLADNITTTSLVLIPNQIEDKEETSRLLSEILNITKEEMDEHINKVTSIERVHPEGRQLDYETSDKIASLNLPGVYLVKESKRYYPYGEDLAHVLGYVGIDNQGLSGLELQYDEYLTGEQGAIKYFSDAKGNRLELSEVYVQPQSGMNIQLTIDYNIQMAVEREMDNIVDMFAPDMALAVVIDPNNGEILAMSSRPTFDPNDYQNYTMEVLSRNLPIWASYEPGSTFKILTTAAAVEEGVVDLENDMFYDSGHVMVEGARINCWKSGGHGEQTFLQVLQNSCNPGFVELGNRLGTETLFSYLDLFGIGEKTGIDLNGEGEGIIFPVEEVGPVELATTAFGQGVSVTPIQQVTSVASVVNGGNLYEPFIVKNILEPETNTIIKTFDEELIRTTISEETSNVMKYALETVVALGGGKAAYIDGYRVGGKTGTAQKVEDGKYLVNNYIMSFVGIVPSNEPEAILYLAIDNPKNTAMLSSYTTTPIARNILVDIIEALDIEKQSNQIEKDYTWSDKIYYEVPDVEGLTKEEATKLLENFTVEYSGNGDTVLSQSPAPNTRIAATSTVKLMLSN